MSQNVTHIIHKDRHGHVQEDRPFSVPLTSDEGESESLAMSQKAVTDIANELREQIGGEGSGSIREAIEEIDGKVDTLEQKSAQAEQNIAALQEGLSDAGKVDDVKVNGVSVLDPETKEANIKITASVVENDEPGTPTVNTTVQDGNINIEFEHIKGVQGNRGNGIARISEQQASGSGEVNIITITDDNGNSHEIRIRNGKQGESIAPQEGMVPVAHDLGEDSGKVMSQKGVTDAIRDVDLVANGEEADLDIIDDAGNVIMRLENGHVKTQKFDSSQQAMTVEEKQKLAEVNPEAEPNEVVTSNEGNADLDIADESGNVVLQIQGGHIRTKNFHSDEINAEGNSVTPKFLLGEINSDGYLVLDSGSITTTNRMYTPLIRVAKGDVVRVLDATKIGGMMVTEYYAPCILQYNENGNAYGKKKTTGSNGYILTDYTIADDSTRFVNVCVKLPDNGNTINSNNFYKNIVIIRKSGIDDKPRYNVPSGYYVSHHSEYSGWTQDTNSNNTEYNPLTLDQIYDACQTLEDNYPDYVKMEEIGTDASGTYKIYKLTLKPHYALTAAGTNYVHFNKQPKVFVGAMVHGDEYPNGRALMNAITHICYAGDFTITKTTVVKEGSTIISEANEDITPNALTYNTQLVGTSSTSESGGQTTTTFYKYKYEEYINNPFLKYLRWNVELIIIPVRNPWGYVNHKRRNANVVDLNRNFLAGGAWYNYGGVTIGGEHVDDQGVSPMSEPETQVCWKVLMENADVLGAFDLHAHGVWGNTNTGTPTWFEKTAFPICNLMPECRDMLEDVAVAINRGFTESGWANHRMPKDSGPVGIIQYDGMGKGTFGSSGIDLGIPTASPEVMHKYYTGASESGSKYNEDIDCMNEEYIVNILLETINQNNLKR